MTSPTTRKLARKLNRPPAATRSAPSGPWAVGTVTAVNLSTNSLTVTIQGDTTAIAGISFMDSYMPVVGDNVQLVRIKNHYWVLGAVAGAYQPVVGPAASANYITGGANRANTEPFTYWKSAVVTVGAGSSWSFTTSGVSFLGCGSFNVTPGDTTGSLALLTVIDGNCSISGGNLTLAGAALQAGGSGVTASSLIRVNISAVGW